MLFIFIVSATVFAAFLGLAIYLVVAYRQLRVENPELSNIIVERYGDELLLWDADKKEIIEHLPHNFYNN